MAITDVVKTVFDEILKQVGKTVGPTKRAVRRKRPTTATQSAADAIGKLLKPARKQTSRAKTTRTRSTAQKRRVAAKTASHRKSLRVGKARR